MRKNLNHNLGFLVLAFLLAWSSAFVMPESFAGETFKNLTVFDAHQMIEEQGIQDVLDVRTDVEYAQSHLSGAVFIPLMVLDKRLHELKKDHTILVYCYKGKRSKMAGEYLASKGFKKVYNMLGGIDSWIKEGYEVVR